MTSVTEQQLAQELRAVLSCVSVGGSIDESESLRDALTSLEVYIPAVLREIHDEWRYESLDGFYSTVARKTRDYELELVGLCILISDQTLTPLHIRLEISPDEDEIVWLECKLGEAGRDGMVRIPYGSTRVGKLANADRIKTIEWVYRVGFGEQSSPSSP